MKMPETVSSVHEIIRAAKAVDIEFDGHAMWRGQECFDWPLVPKVYRDEHGPEWEHSIASRFRFQAKTRYANCPSNDDLAAWLFLMQHYGLPTRLLDWTHAVLCAAFFTVRKRSSEDGVLCALDPIRLNEQQERGAHFLAPGAWHSRRLIEPVFIRDRPAWDHTEILAIGADHIDLRMTVQQSIFTIHSNATPLEQLDDDDSEPILLKFRIPKTAKHLIAAELSLLGINESSLFPDLDALARYLTAQYSGTLSGELVDREV